MINVILTKCHCDQCHFDEMSFRQNVILPKNLTLTKASLTNNYFVKMSVQPIAAASKGHGAITCSSFSFFSLMMSCLWRSLLNRRSSSFCSKSEISFWQKCNYMLITFTWVGGSLSVMDILPTLINRTPGPKTTYKNIRVP